MRRRLLPDLLRRPRPCRRTLTIAGCTRSTNIRLRAELEKLIQEDFRRGPYQSAGRFAERWLFLPRSSPRCPMPPTTEKTRQPKKVTQVVPAAVVVNLVDAQTAFEERNHEHNRRDKTVPDSQPKAGHDLLFVRCVFC